MIETAPLLIRADASGTMGIGHVMRCIALAQAWQDRGGTVYFISTLDSPLLQERLKQENMVVLAIKAAPASDQDLLETVTAARTHDAAWLVIDGYHFSRDYILGIQRAGLHLMLLDDVADRDLSGVEVVLNQNAYATVTMYQHSVPCPKLLLGAPHTLLRREFLMHDGEKEIRREATRVLVTLGGADVPNATQHVMQALRQITRKRLEIRLIVGSANQHLAALQKELHLLRDKHAADILINPPDIPALMTWSDATITAAGSSCWELCRLGVPQFMLVTADNQRLMPPYFVEHGIADVFGAMNDSRVTEFAQRLDALLQDFDKRSRLSQAARRLIDGSGAARVVDFMLQHS
jgi:UDP-2,4-diacetamido-2,4,6-trideoxy-beta-L-altropyranose hydrolase